MVRESLTSATRGHALPCLIGPMRKQTILSARTIAEAAIAQEAQRSAANCQGEDRSA
jgi:hypothetical protein